MKVKYFVETKILLPVKEDYILAKNNKDDVISVESNHDCKLMTGFGSSFI